MPSDKTNYIPNVKMVVEIIYPRSESLATATNRFAETYGIKVSVDKDIIHQNLYHRKRSRNEMLDYIRFDISDDAFKSPSITNQKLIGILQNVLRALDPDLKFDMELIDFTTEVLNNICSHCATIGVTSYYARH